MTPMQRGCWSQATASPIKLASFRRFARRPASACPTRTPGGALDARDRRAKNEIAERFRETVIGSLTRNGDPSMRIFSLAAIAVVACAHQNANVPEPAAAASPQPEVVATPEPAPPPSAGAAAPTPVAGPVERRAVQSANAPKAVGPYSHAIQAPAGRVLFLSGQIAVDPVRDRLIKGDVVKQTDRAMQNLKAVLASAGASFDDVVKTNIYVADLNEFTQINETYGRYFQKSPPARATVQMAALPQGARVEIECVAATGARPAAALGAVQSALAPKAVGPYSQGIGVSPGSFLFVSGQIPVDPTTGQPVQG